MLVADGTRDLKKKDVTMHIRSAYSAENLRRLMEGDDEDVIFSRKVSFLPLSEQNFKTMVLRRSQLLRILDEISKNVHLIENTLQNELRITRKLDLGEIVAQELNPMLNDIDPYIYFLDDNTREIFRSDIANAVVSYIVVKFGNKEL
ncbi:hypothetical protein GCM10007874_50850 [Labrys miyagiensis]|uniref:Uncharacterized protein n=2 Tax=Labrys miyagiensis TaxID=346912 RepID=A0ABQ6CNZ1_9HYPH|nr:hypothetical protein GCM10007874_50850 [Labrys miyagiensis]